MPREKRNHKTNHTLRFLTASAGEKKLLSKLSGTSLFNFYSPALKGCWGIVFNHGVLMGGQVAGKSLSRLYLRNHKCRKLILVRDIGWGV